MANPESPQFSDTMFNDQVKGHYNSENIRREETEHRAESADEARDIYEESLEGLTTIAKEVAGAAKNKPATADHTTQFYVREEKSRARRFMNNRGSSRHAEGPRGWILVPSTDDVVTKPPGKASLANDSGLGLMLTEDGQLYGYTAQKGMNSSVIQRLQPIERRRIGRHTFMPKDELRVLGFRVVSMSEETFMPRYRPEANRPTLLLAIDDPNNKLVTPMVIDQCYDALARFVQVERLVAP